MYYHDVDVCHLASFSTQANLLKQILCVIVHEAVGEFQNEAFFVGVVDFCNLECTEFDSSLSKENKYLAFNSKNSSCPKKQSK